MTVNMYIATIAWLLLVVGFALRKNHQMHPYLMFSGITTDLVLVLYLQVTRSAVQKAASFTLDGLQMTHIGFSTLAILFYFPTLYFGIKLHRGGDVSALLPWHKRVALPALVFRSLGFVFMFSMIE